MLMLRFLILALFLAAGAIILFRGSPWLFHALAIPGLAIMGYALYLSTPQRPATMMNERLVAGAVSVLGGGLAMAFPYFAGDLSRELTMFLVVCGVSSVVFGALNLVQSLRRRAD
ncbi:MAG: hypothetical protein K2X61_14945 [Caulobacteraceae bacterium]|nr:hypothetical protein [Caulobacteraceae bacterium]